MGDMNVNDILKIWDLNKNEWCEWIIWGRDKKKRETDSDIGKFRLFLLWWKNYVKEIIRDLITIVYNIMKTKLWIIYIQEYLWTKH